VHFFGDATTSSGEVPCAVVRLTRSFFQVKIFPNFVAFCDWCFYPELTGEFTLLEEPSDDSNIASVLGLLADGSSFIESERRDEPDGPTKMLKLPIVNSISSLPSSSVLLLAKSEKAVEFMIPTPRVPMVSAN
jgi:hypothetical protein